MNKRYVAIWFMHLKTDWMIRQQPALKAKPFVLVASKAGRPVITEVSFSAEQKGIREGMALADARIIFPETEPLDDHPGLNEKLLLKLCLWCIRYTPSAAVFSNDMLMLDVSGCTHLWHDEENYLTQVTGKLQGFGYHVRAAMADTVGLAFGICKYSPGESIIKKGLCEEALRALPPKALRLEADVVERLNKLGLYRVESFMHIARSALRRRFGNELLYRIDCALGKKEEDIQSTIPLPAYCERLPCLDPVHTRTAIEIALTELLKIICNRLQKEGKGMRKATFTCYRADDHTTSIDIITNHPSHNITHLYKLFELKISKLAPGPGIELFTLDCFQPQPVTIVQQTFFTSNSNLEAREIAELLDGLESKYGHDIIHRYLPDEHHLPERSVTTAITLTQKSSATWRNDKMRPVQLLPEPASVQVTAPVPDYPPMNFRYRGKLHTIKKSDACERIESEWWLNEGLHRDYYLVEDEEGKRFWLFRLGHYDEQKKPEWFLHGFFA